MKLIQFGAGNIGRSFIGALFSQAGWEVVFVDVDPRIVSLLNEKRYYRVLIKRDGRDDEERLIGPVRAVDGRDGDLVVRELAGADLAATSVGKGALPRLLPVIGQGLRKRWALKPERPLDIIIAENARHAPELFRTILGTELGPEYPLEKLVGMVETSIGKMVPLMRPEDLAADPLLLFAEEYETLIVDRQGFRGPLPDIPALYPVDAIAAYVDRKLFIHNLGHAAAAYLGYRADPEKKLLCEVLELPGVAEGTRDAMEEAADALVLEYPAAYSRPDLSGHIADLLLRFRNRALGDTVYRVGRDLQRKLGRDDRLLGAMLLCARHQRPFGAIAAVFRSALEFAALDENGTLFPEDARFRSVFSPDAKGVFPLRKVLESICGLDSALEPDRKIFEVLGEEGHC
jgi:mannitol-1-phosphate 5-dehydrogenase